MQYVFTMLAVYLEFLSFKVIAIKKDVFFISLYVFFDVESESEVCFGRSPLVFEL